MKANPDQEPVTEPEFNIAADKKKEIKLVWVEKEKEQA